MPYYKVIDEGLNEKIEIGYQKRNETSKKIEEFANEIKASKIFVGEHIGGQSFQFSFEENISPNNKAWKRVYRDKANRWTPKHSTKEGKELIDKLEHIRKNSFSHFDFGKLFGLNFFQAPGLKSKLIRKGSKKRTFFVSLPEGFRPSGRLKNKLKRITDIEWEKIK